MALGRKTIRDATAVLLIAGVPLVAGRVYSARSWPLIANGAAITMPALLLYMFKERKSLLSEAGGSPCFRVTGTLAIHCRSEARTAALIEAELDTLAGQVEDALLTSADWVKRFDRIPSIETTIAIQSEAEQSFGEAAIGIDLVWNETFEPTLANNLTTIAARGDGTAPADLLGTYPPVTGFPPAVAPPRATGPDGRMEAGFYITLPS